MPESDPPETGFPRRVALGFSLLMFAGGAYDLTRPEPLRQAMRDLSMPAYMLLILGVAKILGAVTLQLERPAWLREWTLAGFSVWLVGGVACHLFSGHGAAQTAPILVAGSPLIYLVWATRRAG